MTRRELLSAAAAATVLPASALLAHEVPVGSRVWAYRAGVAEHRFFDDGQARFIDAVCERLIPANASGFGALAAGVRAYLDAQLLSPWGQGKTLYRSGDWQPGTPGTTHPVFPSPARLFQTSLHALLDDAGRCKPERHCAPNAISYDRWPGPAQDAYLRRLESGSRNLDGVPSEDFFQALLAMTVEGFFIADSGAHRDRIAWRLRGFPGALAVSLSSPADGSMREYPAGDVP